MGNGAAVISPQVVGRECCRARDLSPTAELRGGALACGATQLECLLHNYHQCTTLPNPSCEYPVNL